MFKTPIGRLSIMADSIHINLSNCAFRPEELSLLLEEWTKVSRPKTINELARAYLSNCIKAERGYYPYDRRNQFKKGDTIIVKPTGKEICLAQIIEVIKHGGSDHDGFAWDRIDLILLDQTTCGQKKFFISNYQGKELAGSAIAAEIIKEKDEIEVIPKILLAMSNDGRFVRYRDRWLPAKFLESAIRQGRDKVREIIAASKQALSAREILENLGVDQNDDCLGSCLEFSVNYFLEQDKRFDENAADTTKWDLRKPSTPVHIELDNKRFLYNKSLAIPLPLDLLIFYHGFVKQCVFLFPYGRCATADYDNKRRLLSGDEFIRKLSTLSDTEQFKVKFGHPEQRGGPIPVSVLTSEGIEEKVQSAVTIREEWVEKGVLVLPKKISNYMEGTNTVHIIYDQVDETLPYDETERLIDGLRNFYSVKAVAEFDRVHLRLEGLDPTRLFIFSTWQRSLNKLLSIEPQDLDWEHSSLRDCIIVTLAKFKKPAHYREIYTKIAPHKKVSLSGVGTTLSHYTPSVFTHVGWSKWQLAGFCGKEETAGVESGKTEHPSNSAERPDEETWKAIQIIEENDYVYRLLEQKGRQLNFNDICNELAAILRVDADKLKATGFLNPNDERLRRLDTGEWALEEWFKPPQPVSEENISVPNANENADGAGDLPETTAKSGISTLFLAILIIVLFLITIAGVLFFWLFF